MAWPYTTLPVDLELYANGWQDISTRWRRASGLAITHAQPSGQGWEPAPSTLQAVLDNQDGALSRRNPAGPYFGYLNRNAPIRAAVRATEDDFTRTVSNGWGTSSSGHAWSTGGAGGTVQPSDYGVDGDEGWLSVPVSGGSRFTYLATEPHRDIDVTMSFRLSINDVLGGSIQFAILFRGQSSTEFYRARLTISNVGEQAGLEIADLTGATLSNQASLGSFASLATVPAFIRVQVEGRGARARAWSSSVPEPATWQVTAVLPDDLPGWVGPRFIVDTPNTNAKPLRAYVDNVRVRIPLFSGRAAIASSEWGPSEAPVWLPIQANGELYQIRDSAAVLPSAPRQYLPTTNPVAYWPMESGRSVDALPDVTGKATPLRAFTGTHPSGAVIGSPRWGSGDLAPWLPPVVSRSGQQGMTVLWANVTMSSFAGTWTVDRMFTGGTQGADAAIDINPSYLGGALGWPQLAFWTTSATIAVSMNALPEVTASVPGLFDGQPHHVRWICTQAGGSVNWSVHVDGTSVLSGTVAMTLAAISSIGLVASGGASHVEGHLGIWTTPPALATAVSAAFGWRGETAGRRAKRLCDQQGVDFFAHGDLDETSRMGPQQAASLADLLDECAVADGGQLYDSRAGGVAYLPLAAIQNQASSLALTYSTRGHVAPPLTPVEDDRITNDITVTRRYGLSTQLEQTTGPLAVATVGRRPMTVTATVEVDDQAKHLAGWMLRLGTWDQPRYTELAVDLLALAGTGSAGYALALSAASLGPYDRVTVAGLPVWCGPGLADQLVAGARMTVDEIGWRLSLNCVPAGPYDVFQLEHPTLGRLHPEDATLAVGVDADDLALSVATPAGKPLWTTDPADFPMDLELLLNADTPVGEVVTVSAIAGTASPQTFTVSARSVNGVVRSWPAGSLVELATKHAFAYAED